MGLTTNQSIVIGAAFIILAVAVVLVGNPYLTLAFLATAFAAISVRMRSRRDS